MTKTEQKNSVLNSKYYDRRTIVDRMKQHDILSVFLFNFILAFLSFIIIIIRNKGLFTLCDDFNKQEIPLCMLVDQAVRSGNFGWCSNIDLGTDFIGGTSWCTLGSLFTWLACLFPKNAIPYVTGWMFMLKYAVAGATSYAYIRIFCHDRRYAALGSILYAFSGFQSTNLLFYTFHDISAFFPLLLIGVERTVKEDKKGSIILPTAILASFNFYFLFAEVIFVFIYFFVRFGFEDRRYLKKIGYCLIEGTIGILISCAVLFPSLMFNLKNPRLGDYLKAEDWFDFGRRYFLKLIRVFLFPADAMSCQSYVLDKGDFSSWSAYLPMVGIIPVTSFLLNSRKKRTWLTHMMAVMILFAVTPVLNSIFGVFAANNYHRWYFMLILMMSLATAVTLENRSEYHIGRTSFIFLIFTGLVTAGTWWWNKTRFQMIFDERYFVIVVVIALSGTAAMFLISFIKNEKIYFRSMLAAVSMFAVITTLYCAVQYKDFANGEDANEESELYYDRMRALEQIKSVEPAYRFDSNDNVLTMAASNSGTGSFLSTVDASIFRFYTGLGEERKVFTPKLSDDMKHLLSARYSVSTEKKEGVIETVSYGKYTGYVYEDTDVLPIGYTYDSYITYDEYAQIDKNQRPAVMFQYLVVPSDRENEISKTLRHGDISDIKSVSQITAENNRNESENFRYTKSGFECSIDADKNEYAFFSVPDDENWKAYVNGKTAEIIDSEGMMTVRISKGKNDIAFRYHNRYLDYGIVISMIGIALCILYLKKRLKEKLFPIDMV